MKISLKESIESFPHFKKIEFWTAIVIFLVMAIGFMTDALSTYSDLYAPNKLLFDQANAHFSFYRNYFFPVIGRFTTIFAGFMLLNFRLVPKLWEAGNNRGVILKIVLAVLAGFVFFTLTRLFSRAYLVDHGASLQLFGESLLSFTWLLLAFAVYTGIKYLGFYLLTNSEEIEERYKFIKKEGIAAMIIWIFSMFLLRLVDAHREVMTFWGMLLPTAICFYSLSHYSLIPKSLPAKRPFRRYMLICFGILFAFGLASTFVLVMVIADDEVAISFSMLNAFFQFIFTAPLSWLIFKRQMKGKEEVYMLQRELKQTSANFDFLRSQINPHFLFNALNTIYGTAIQEKAERTSEGIEKLGGMMRFMLQENTKEKIPLSREIEYLNNYIELQKLRTEANPNIRISTSVEQAESSEEIAPMLLIPFVENAFKHGISFREDSHIGIALELKEKTLYFDVHNSKHEKHESDPERFSNGIGLQNVKLRLQLLYANKHQLIIRETKKEFFVHLTIELS